MDVCLLFLIIGLCKTKFQVYIKKRLFSRAYLLIAIQLIESFFRTKKLVNMPAIVNWLYFLPLNYCL